MPSETLRGHNPAIDEATVRDIVDSQGGVEGLVAKMNDFHEVVLLMRKERAMLMEEHPDRWLAMGKDGVVVSGNSIDGVLEKVDAQGVKRGEVMIEFLETDHPSLILWSARLGQPRAHVGDSTSRPSRNRLRPAAPRARGRFLLFLMIGLSGMGGPARGRFSHL